MGHKVFIVEDEPDLRDTLKYNLENEGFSVKAFSNGEDFLSSVHKNWYSYVNC
jgi:DNA-binding response OmpR family regulator